MSFIIANGHLKPQMLQFNINIINTVNKKKQYQHSGSYLPWYGVSMPYLWAGLSVLSQFLKKNVSLDCINHFGERRSVSLTFFTLGVVPLIDQSIDWLRNCMLIKGCWQQIRHRMTRKLDVSQWDGLSYQECRRRSLHHCNRISYQTLALALKKKRLTIKFLFSWQIGTLFHIYNRVFANQVEEVDKYLYSKLTSLCTLTLTVYVFLSQSFFLEPHIQMMLRLKL